MVPMGTFLLTIGSAFMGLVISGATFYQGALSADKDHEKRLTTLEDMMSKESESRQRIDRNIIRIGAKLNIKDLETP